MQDDVVLNMLGYQAERQVSAQWRGFLTALAEEFGAQLGVDQCRSLFERLGGRFALAEPLPACATLSAMQIAANRVWRPLDWGWVEFHEQPDFVSITHYCSPLAALGPTASAWAPAYLEGAYRTWFTAAGANGLQLKQHGEVGSQGQVELRLER
jgi:hypothetical protein